MLPNLLKDAILSVEGVGYAGKVDIEAWPKLSRKMEEYRAGGMSGPVEFDLGSEKLELEFKAYGIDKSLLKLYGKTGVDSVAFRINGATEKDNDSCDTQAVEVIGRGRFREIDMGSSKPDDMGEVKYSAALSFFKLDIDSEEVIEVDNLNYIFKVDGKDRLEKRRKALKL